MTEQAASEAIEYERIPTRIMAVEFQPSVRPWPLNVNAQHDLADNDFYVWNKMHKSKINLKPGDMVRVDDPNDTYPIDRATFEKTYRKPQPLPSDRHLACAKKIQAYCIGPDADPMAVEAKEYERAGIIAILQQHFHDTEKLREAGESVIANYDRIWAGAITDEEFTASIDELRAAIAQQKEPT